jgi:hypothetical protein
MDEKVGFLAAPLFGQGGRRRVLSAAGEASEGCEIEEREGAFNVQLCVAIVQERKASVGIAANFPEAFLIFV